MQFTDVWSLLISRRTTPLSGLWHGMWFLTFLGISPLVLVVLRKQWLPDLFRTVLSEFTL